MPNLKVKRIGAAMAVSVSVAAATQQTQEPDPLEAELFEEGALLATSHKGEEWDESSRVVGQAALECEDWNTGTFFARANAADVSYCVNAGADVNAENKDGWTPLRFAAARSKDAAVVAALVEAGADVNAEDEHGRTPLRLAARSNGAAVVVALVEAGADVNMKYKHGRTPLHYAAAESKDASVVEDIVNEVSDENA